MWSPGKHSNYINPYMPSEKNALHNNNNNKNLYQLEQISLVYRIIRAF